ncbi:hypothetical protein FQA39_LY16411 [Lamprigera yunnana]|nr:hypothetical protein FQA39_LY16411 [Lamprigera yunnana]
MVSNQLQNGQRDFKNPESHELEAFLKDFGIWSLIIISEECESFNYVNGELEETILDQLTAEERVERVQIRINEFEEYRNAQEIDFENNVVPPCFEMSTFTQHRCRA